MKVLLGKCVITNDGTRELYRSIEIPFAPFPGLEIHDTDNNFEDTIAQVCCNIETGEIVAWTPADDASHLSWKKQEEEIGRWLDWGWEEEK